MTTRAQRHRDETDPKESTRRCWRCGADAGMLVDGDLRQAYCFECGFYTEMDLDELDAGQLYACPECDTVAYERENKTPKFRCQEGHEFSQPRIREKKSHDPRQ